LTFVFKLTIRNKTFTLHLHIGSMSRDRKDSHHAASLQQTPAILFTAMTAFVVGFSWLLHWLAVVMGLSGFMVFCVLTFVVMASCGFAWDRHEARSARRRP